MHSPASPTPTSHCSNPEQRHEPVTPALDSASDPASLLTRRIVLLAGVTVVGAAGAAGLAGCSGGSKGVNAQATTSTSGGDGATTATGTGGGTMLAKMSDIPVGNAISATLDGKPILISQPAAGQVVAFTAICTHMGCTVAPAGKQFHCPCHGSVYDAATGAVIHGPAPRALAKIATHVVDGEVVSGA